MTKQVKGAVWYEKNEDGTMNIGFTRNYIESQLMECFHVLQADSKNLVEGGPMLVIESNDGLESLKSPVTGTTTYFNPKARNFPDRLTETDTILSVLPKGVVLPAKKKAQVGVEGAARENPVPRGVRTLEQLRQQYAGWNFTEAQFQQIQQMELQQFLANQRNNNGGV